MRQAGSTDQLGQRLHRVAVELLHPLRFVRHHQRTLTQLVLGGNAGRAEVGMAGARLNAAQGKHEAARRIAPVGAQRHGAHDVEGRDDLARGAESDVLTQADAGERVVHQAQSFAQRHADMVGELHRRSTGTAFAAIDHDEIGIDTGLQHGLGHAKEFPGLTDTELEAHWLAMTEFTQATDEIHQLQGCRKLGVTGRRDTVLAHRHIAREGDLGRHLGRWQHAAMSGLGALRDFDFDHLDLRVGGLTGEVLRRELSMRGAATKVARTQLPDDVATEFTVIRRQGALTGVVRKATELGATIQGADGIGRERTETHGRDVEHRGRIRHTTLRAADADAKTLGTGMAWCHGLAQPLAVLVVDRLDGAEATLVVLPLGTRIHQGTLIARERQLGFIVFQKILAYLRPDVFQQKTAMTDQRVVAQDGVMGLHHIGAAHQEHQPEQNCKALQ